MKRVAKLSRTVGLVAAAALAVATLGPAAGADAPAGRYTVMAGTVKDLETGLVWNQLEQPGGPWSWVDAQDQCAAPWRVPTVQELRTISDLTQTTSPAIDRTVFHGPTMTSLPSGGWVWTSTVYKLGPQGYSFYVSFDDGQVSADDPTQPGRVRCVQ
ncbi:MAG TPA: DUF1566 domain-containing protein [Polyangiaceae bacterium]